jgi:hypothetical protein
VYGVMGETASPTADQPELPLPFPELSGDLPLLPARMVNEYQYCLRFAAAAMPPPH